MHRSLGNSDVDVDGGVNMISIDIKTGSIIPSPDKKIAVMEVFGPTLQGEGALAGQISYFLRTGGCPYRCSWCDQPEAVDPQQIHDNATYMTQEEIINKVRELTKKAPTGQWITFSGGDPLIWDLSKVILALRVDEMRIAVETQGSMKPDWLTYVDLITVSPKPPSSGMQDRYDGWIIQHYIDRYKAERVVLKVVIFTEEDLDFAEKIKARFPKVRFYLSVGTPIDTPIFKLPRLGLERAILDGYSKLVHKVLNERPKLWGATISPQMHALLWGHEKGK